MRSLEDVLHDVGGAGRFQLAAVAASSLPKVWMAWSMLEMSFANYVPQWCCLPDNMTGPVEEYWLQDKPNCSFAKECQANTSTRCTRRVFASDVNTIVNEWDLVCERKWMLPMTTSIQMAGVLVGAFVAGQMMDLIGRKKTLFTNAALNGVFSIAAGFSTTWNMFAAFRFLIGLTIGGYLAVNILYVIEFLAPPKRKLIIIIPTWNIGACLLALSSWRLQDWRWVHWVGGIAMMPCLIGYFFIPESMRWLAAQGHIEEAQKVVEWIARWNRRSVPQDSLDVIKAVAAEERKSGSESKSNKYTYLNIYKGWHLFKTSVILQLLWMFLSMCAYGISFGAASLGFNVYLNIFLMSVINFPFQLALNFVIDKTGRKKAAIVMFVTSSVCGFGALLSLLFVPDSEKAKRDTVINICNILARGFQSNAWGAIGMITNEAYPTVMRGLASGAANVFARVGGTIAPFALNIEDTPTIAFALMGSILLVCALIVPLLDETTGIALPDTTKHSKLVSPNKEMEVLGTDHVTRGEARTDAVDKIQFNKDKIISDEFNKNQNRQSISVDRAKL